MNKNLSNNCIGYY